jgi:hypothetical protein
VCPIQKCYKIIYLVIPTCFNNQVGSQFLPGLNIASCNGDGTRHGFHVVKELIRFVSQISLRVVEVFL